MTLCQRTESIDMPMVMGYIMRVRIFFKKRKVSVFCVYPLNNTFVFPNWECINLQVKNTCFINNPWASKG